jgi:hypothetical protein
VFLARLSPAFAFHQAASTLAGSGLNAYRDLSGRLQDYRRTFSETLWTLVKQDPDIPDPAASVDLSVLPAFSGASSSFTERARLAAPDLLVLAGFLATTIAMGAIAFARAVV